MSTTFTVFNVANQTPTINVADLTATNLTVTSHIETSDGAFTRTTVVGYMPNNFPGSSLNDILPFMESPGSDSTLGDGYIVLPRNATIVQCTLSNNGQTVTPGGTAFRIYTSTQLNSLPVPPPPPPAPIPPGSSIMLYQSPSASDLNSASVLVVKDTSVPNALGDPGAPPEPYSTLGDHSFVLLSPSANITTGDVRITVQYDTPIIAN